MTLRFLPAPAGSGVRFLRSDLPGRPSCPAHASCSLNQPFRTGLSRGTASLAMVEHVMAALYALEIDNCTVEADSEEMPGLDGSSAPLTAVLQEVGMIVQAAARKRYIVDRTFRVGDDAAWVTASPSSGGRAIFEYHLDYGATGPIAPQQYRGTLTPHGFCRDLAPARTFITEAQADAFRAQGFGSHVGDGDLLIFDDRGVRNNTLRFPDECARHKTLDLIGDLALSGIELIGRFVSYRGGHRLNGELARQLSHFADASAMSTDAGSQSAPPQTRLRRRAA